MQQQQVVLVCTDVKHFKLRRLLAERQQQVRSNVKHLELLRVFDYQQSTLMLVALKYLREKN